MTSEPTWCSLGGHGIARVEGFPENDRRLWADECLDDLNELATATAALAEMTEHRDLLKVGMEQVRGAGMHSSPTQMFRMIHDAEVVLDGMLPSQTLAMIDEWRTIREAAEAALAEAEKALTDVMRHADVTGSNIASRALTSLRKETETPAS